MTTYSSPVPRIGGGREIFPNLSLDKIAATPDGAWVQLNENFYSDSWPPGGLRTSLPPSNMFRAWSSFAWDRRRHGFWFWGGGHANYTGNEVYFWSAVTGLWSLAFHAATAQYYAGGTNAGKAFASSDGIASPLSAHTYDNNIYLPILDRFLTFGGAGQGLARPFEVFDGETRLRRLGAYTLQPALAGQDMLGGVGGVNYQGAGYETTVLPGARAWEPRDWLLDNASYIAMNIPTNDHINCGTCYREENGHDVVYWLRTQVTTRNLCRTEFVDHDYRNDIHTKLTGYNDSGGGQGVIAMDPVRGITLHLLNPGQTNFMQAYDVALQSSVKISELVGDPTDIADFMADLDGSDSGMDFDPVRGCFVVWDKGPNVWRIDAPPTWTGTGWTLTRVNTSTTPAPINAMIDNQTGTLGKWEYAPDMDCFIGAIEPINGNVWAWRPHGWTDPRIT